LGQFIDHFSVVLLVGLPDLLAEFHYFAIALGFDFVAADDCHDLRASPTLWACAYTGTATTSKIATMNCRFIRTSHLLRGWLLAISSRHYRTTKLASKVLSRDQIGKTPSDVKAAILISPAVTAHCFNVSRPVPLVHVV
jgi:hypothetical protein